MFHSLAKRKMHTKINESFLISQVRSCMLSYTSQILEKSFFFLSVPYLEYDFMVANIVRLNLAVLKISETSQERTSGGVLC